MLLCLHCLLVGFICGSAAGPYITPESMVRVLENRTAVLPCPDTGADLKWTRFKGGTEVVLVPLTNKQVQITDKRFGSLPNGSLVLNDVKKDDEGMYRCNGKHVFLTVIPESSGLVPKVQPEDKITPRETPKPDRRGTAAAGEPEPGPKPEPSPEMWKIPLGLLVGSALVVLVLLTLRFWTKMKAERKSNRNQFVTEAIYQEVQDNCTEPRTEPHDPGPYYATVSSAPAPGSSLVDGTRTHGRETCVYSLLQISDQTATR